MSFTASGLSLAALKDSQRLVNSQYPIGRVLWQENFALADWNVFGWVPGPAAENQVGGICERSLNRSLVGSRASLHVNNPVDSSIQTGAKSFSLPIFGYSPSTPRISRVGVEFWWTYNKAMRTAANSPNYDFFFQWWDGALRWNGGMLFSPNNTNNVFLVTSAAGGVAVPGAGNTPTPAAYDDTTFGSEQWFNHKLTIDVSKGSFVKLESSYGTFDLTGNSSAGTAYNPVLSTGDTTVPKGMCRVGVACNTAASTPAGGMDVYVGAIIVTDET
jgi:hypothetical protein